MTASTTASVTANMGNELHTMPHVLLQINESVEYARTKDSVKIASLP
ncbi:hypothetical protein C8E00_10515 [Chromohalobacter marismortui]|uniref:Uncharacterized protein n=2 Tax=Halomonadaceae TaxID=28256 RepID=A0A4R7NMA5_9GAMM|nr:hypothetical protein C8E00_10515 [Chromohalobacter marismortui]